MADSWTQTPNFILDNMAIMKPAVFKVCMVVVRQTCGYIDENKNRKEWDKLSTSRIMQLSGLSNRAVIDAVEEAIKDGWIERRPSGQYFEYRIQPMKKVHSEPVKAVQTYENSSQVNERTYENSSQVAYENSSQVNQTYENSSQEPMKIVHTQKKIEINKKEGEDNHSSSNEKVSPPPSLSLPSYSNGNRSYNGSQSKTAEQVKAAKDLGLSAEQFRLNADALLDGFGKTALADAGDDIVLNHTRELVLIMARMNERFKTVEGLESIFESWKTNDYRGETTPSSTQYKEHASLMLAGKVKQKTVESTPEKQLPAHKRVKRLN